MNTGLSAAVCARQLHCVTHTLQPVGIKKQEMKHTAPNSEIRIQRPKSPEENTKDKEEVEWGWDGSVSGE